jgi:hypothetical protein
VAVKDVVVIGFVAGTLGGVGSHGMASESTEVVENDLCTVASPECALFDDIYGCNEGRSMAFGGAKRSLDQQRSHNHVQGASCHTMSQYS